MTAAEIASLAALALWLAVSVAGQVQPLSRRLRRWDHLGVIPGWRFFGPQPAQSDPYLLFRDRRADGTFGPWREAPAGHPRRPWRGLWNPGRRHEKALADAQRQLLRHALRSSPASWPLSLPYLLLLKYVSDLPRLDDPAATQFALMSSRGGGAAETAKVLFLSDLHPVEAQP